MRRGIHLPVTGGGARVTRWFRVVALVGLAIMVLAACGGGSREAGTPANSTPKVI